MSKQHKISRYTRVHAALPVLECTARLCAVTLRVRPLIALEQRHGHLKLFLAAGNKEEAWRMIALQVPLLLSRLVSGARHLECLFV